MMVDGMARLLIPGSKQNSVRAPAPRAFAGFGILHETGMGQDLPVTCLA